MGHGTQTPLNMVATGLFVLATVLACGLAQDQTNEVAFSAGLSKHQYMTAGQRVKYDTIFTNVGGGSHSNSNMWLELHKNFQYVASIYGHVEQDYAAGGNAVILRLAKNDEVYVQTTDASDL